MTKAKDQAVEQWLDGIEVRAQDAQDATPFRQIVQANQALADTTAELGRVVAAARAAGTSWTVIGAALGVTKQAASQRFGSGSGGQ